ncbi:MAG TPA: hypothetical protein VFF03_02980 [Rhodocyclaceae bacterium]|nr:hypothetical protein [Rhodocyclaceae bacterium]
MNPFSPPKSPVDPPNEGAGHPVRKDPRKNDSRPFGIVVVAALFVVFSIIDALLFLGKDDPWWIVILAVSALIMYLCRDLWWGNGKTRRLLATVGYVLGIAALVFPPEGSEESWSIDEIANALEGLYMLSGALYLTLIRNHRFFTNESDA